MLKFVRLFKEHRFLRFFASVHLAVITMVTISTIVAVGTVYESLYDAEYAKLAVYHSWWFTAILCLLWINIFLATLTRYPFRPHHVGFLITHLGLLTLIAGGTITGLYGIDGQLRVDEGDASSSVALGDQVLGFQFDDSPTAQSIGIKRGLTRQLYSSESGINSEIKHLFWIQEYLPFADIQRAMRSQAGGEPSKTVGVSFKMKSAFFDVSEWLSTEENPVLQMGPATLVLRIGTYSPEKPKPSKSSRSEKPASSRPIIAERQAQPSRSPASTAGETKLVVTDAKNNKIVLEVPLESLRQAPSRVSGVEIRLKQEFRHASVSNNRLVEGNGPEVNPAIELEFVRDGETLREVLFQRFPGFSLRGGDSFGYKFSLNGAVAANESDDVKDARLVTENQSPSALPAGHPPVSAATDNTDQAADSMGNLIEFWVDPNNDADKAMIVLKKNGSEIESKQLAAGETFQTPWMGMTITLGSVVKGGAVESIATPISPVKGMPLPPSAVQLVLNNDGRKVWLSEGSSQRVQLMGRDAQVFFGRRNFELPFKIKLLKFSKKDYPGTETAMSFESMVEIPETGETRLISMNDPLKKDGFTIYQASYVLEPGRPPASIFSVNQDPGRWLKYLGSLILSIGIIVFTVQRSRWWKEYKKAGSA